MSKKIKIVSLLFSSTMGLGVLSSCGSAVNGENVIKGIILEDPKLDYEFGENYSSKNLKVYAEYSNNEKVELSEEMYTINHNEFNMMKPGKYKIEVTTEDKKFNEQYEVNVNAADKLHLLMIGNSFSDDTSKYIYEIANSLGIEDVVVGNMYIGGCNIDTHYQNALTNAKAYEYRTYSNGKWKTTPRTSIEDALMSYDWDFVSLQQASGQSGIRSSLSKLDSLMEYIVANSTNENMKFVWNMTWAYQANSTHGDFIKYDKNQNKMYEAILDLNQNEILTRNFAAIIPNGTAIQNARTSFICDNLTRDGFHLTYDVGRYIAGLTLAGVLTGRDISNINYAPQEVFGPYKTVAIESAKNAINDMFIVTQSKYKTEPELDLTGLREVNLKPVCGAFYNSTDAASFNKLITNNVSLSRKFIATKRFTKEELPIGSLIVCNKGYQYRPEYWLNDEVQSSRPDNRSTKYVKIDTKWWGNYLYRAFNISKTDGTILEGEYDLALENFKIYVPEESYKEDVNSYFEKDKELFIKNAKDIKDYELFDFNPITGYYNSHNPDTKINDLIIELNSNTKTLHTKFVSTPILTKENLPNGSIIVADQGYRYRPDGYLATGKPKVRPGNVTTNFTLINDSWWLDSEGKEFVKRGLNISTTDSKVLTDDIYGHKNHLRIYIPKAE